MNLVLNYQMEILLMNNLCKCDQCQKEKRSLDKLMFDERLF